MHGLQRVPQRHIRLLLFRATALKKEKRKEKKNKLLNKHHF